MKVGETVYVVTSGCYSDYSIDCVCATREAAEAQLGDYRDDGREETWSGSRVEEYLLVDENTRSVPVLMMQSLLFDNGIENRDPDVLNIYGITTKEAESIVNVWPSAPVPLAEWSWCRRNHIKIPEDQGGGGVLLVSGADHERVRKVFSERRALVMTDPAFRMTDWAEGRVMPRPVVS